MRFVYVVAAILVCACSDDEPGDATPPDASADTGTEASLSDAGLDSGVDASEPTGRVGEACDDETDCLAPNDICLTEGFGNPALTFVGGYCTHGAEFDAPCDDFGTGAALPGRGPHCFRLCENLSDCRSSEGYVCRPHPFANTSSVCLPPEPE